MKKDRFKIIVNIVVLENDTPSNIRKKEQIGESIHYLSKYIELTGSPEEIAKKLRLETSYILARADLHGNENYSKLFGNRVKELANLDINKFQIKNKQDKYI